MNYGVPVVATRCAVEGMHLEADREVLVAEDAKAFAEAIATLYMDQSLWNKLSAAGRANVEKYFSVDAVRPALERVFCSTAQTTH
jgi:O-antigen biosynthesis protein